MPKLPPPVSPVTPSESSADSPTKRSKKTTNIQTELLADETKLTFRQKIAQQRLDGMAVLFTVRWAVFLFLFMMFLFIGLGIVLWFAAANLVKYSKEYGPDPNEFQPATPPLNHERAKWNELVTVIEIKVEKEMTAPIMVQYELSKFYQNHRQYEGSLSVGQLRAEEKYLNESGLETSCALWLKQDKKDAKVWYPCGLIAKSIPSDYYMMYKKEENATKWTNVHISETREDVVDNDMDIEKNFRNADDSKLTDSNKWIFSQFPPELCIPELSTEVIDALKPGSKNLTDSSVRPLYVAYTADGQPDCDREKKTCRFAQKPNVHAGPDAVIKTCEDWAKTKDPHTYRSQKFEHYGVESSHVITWFFLAAYPTFNKNWGRIKEDIPAGTTLKIVIQDNFDVISYKGTKKFVIMTTNWLGTDDFTLAIMYFTTAAFCSLATIYLIIVWTKRPRVGSLINIDFTDQQTEL